MASAHDTKSRPLKRKSLWFVENWNEI